MCKLLERYTDGCHKRRVRMSIEQVLRNIDLVFVQWIYILTHVGQCLHLHDRLYLRLCRSGFRSLDETDL